MLLKFNAIGQTQIFCVSTHLFRPLFLKKWHLNLYITLNRPLPVNILRLHSL